MILTIVTAVLAVLALVLVASVWTATCMFLGALLQSIVMVDLAEPRLSPSPALDGHHDELPYDSDPAGVLRALEESL